MQICAFTGHRKINEKHKDKISELVARAIKYAYDKGCRNFLTGGALGFDTIAAKEIIKLIRVCAARIITTKV